MPIAAAMPSPWRRSRKIVHDAVALALRCAGRMTIDETPRGPGPAAKPRHGQPRSSAHELERYAGLFARAHARA